MFADRRFRRSLLGLKSANVAALSQYAGAVWPDRSTPARNAALIALDFELDGLVRDANNRIYSKTGLAKARDALKPGGILAVWSAAPDYAFRKRMKDVRFDVEELSVRSRPNNKGAHHVIWFGRKLG